MTTLLYTGGAASLLALVLPLALAAVRVRARLLVPVTAATARLCEVIIGLAILIVVSEALGSVGLFRRWPLLIGCWIVAGAVVVGTRGADPVKLLPAPRVARLAGTATAIGAGIVVFAFGVGTFSALHGATWDIDSIGYHLPESLRFVQSHRLTAVQFTSLDPAPAYYPADSELLHAVGMVLFDRDVLTMWINLAFAALGLLAGWCLGEALASPPATMLSVGVLAVAPSIAQGGTALNDGVGLALLIAAAALGLSPRGPRVAAVGALAAGLAVGTKLNLLVPIVCLAWAAVVLARRGQRLRTAATWVAGILAGSGFWFVRDLARTGSPLPLLHLGPLPHVRLLPGESTDLVQALHAGTLSIHQMTSALSAGLGRAWPVVLLAALGGLLAGIWRGSRPRRALGLVGIAALVSYAFTPLTGSEFLWTVRYAAPPLALGLALLATVPSWRRRWWSERFVPLGLLVLMAVSLRPPGGSHKSAVVLGVLAAIVTAAALRVVPRPRLGHSAVLRSTAAAATLAALLVAGYAAARTYVRDRFTTTPGSGSTAAALVALARFGEAVTRTRIAVAGIELQYQFAGPALSNYVQYLGDSRSGGNWADISSCAAWRGAVDAGHFKYVVTAPSFWPTSAPSIAPNAPVPWAAWTAGDPAARLILRPYPSVSVFELSGPFHDPGCAASAGGHHHRS